jgi:hypothetical protein
MLEVKVSPSENVAEVTPSSHILVSPYVVLTYAIQSGLFPGLPAKYAICEDLTPLLSMQLASITCSAVLCWLTRQPDEIELNAMKQTHVLHPQRHILKARSANWLMKLG